MELAVKILIICGLVKLYFPIPEHHVLMGLPFVVITCITVLCKIMLKFLLFKVFFCLVFFFSLVYFVIIQDYSSFLSVLLFIQIPA